MFKGIKRSISVVLLGLALGAGAAEWSRYQVILDKHPFGTQVNLTNTAPDFIKNLRLSALWHVRGQLRAGFADVATKRDFVLGCGERTDAGLELIEVRYADATVVLRQGGEVALLHLQAGAIPAGTAANPWNIFNDYSRHHHASDVTSDQPPRIAYSGEQLERHLQEQQLQAIRTGAPPLPVPLTQESANQLVREGFLLSPAP
ncbi:MAG: hypothetical protein NTY53_20590 [Kiritimatiellaeota bacterium]|nr:hypothetical protein [Kiritimatiellota bacterium]